jgi:predicted metal-dependent hydrolase
MDKLAFHNTDPAELARRRGLANATQNRERERQSLVQNLMSVEQRAAQLRAWIETYEARDATIRSPEFERMLDWAREELEVMDAAIDPANISKALCEQHLFPEEDHLFDPFGEPPPHQPWGR